MEPSHYPRTSVLLSPKVKPFDLSHLGLSPLLDKNRNVAAYEVKGIKDMLQHLVDFFFFNQILLNADTALAVVINIV